MKIKCDVSALSHEERLKIEMVIWDATAQGKDVDWIVDRVADMLYDWRKERGLVNLTGQSPIEQTISRVALRLLALEVMNWAYACQKTNDEFGRPNPTIPPYKEPTPNE